MKTRLKPAARRKVEAIQLIEALVYIAVVFVLLGVGYGAFYQCMDSSIALRWNADDITRALHAGERWRADLRAANRQVRLEQIPGEQILLLEGTAGKMAYRFSTNSVFRRTGEGVWVRLLTNVKASAVQQDPRRHVTAWRWELELAPRQKGTIRPSRVRPLFTFIAVPERS